MGACRSENPSPFRAPRGRRRSQKRCPSPDFLGSPAHEASKILPLASGFAGGGFVAQNDAPHRFDARCRSPFAWAQGISSLKTMPRIVLTPAGRRSELIQILSNKRGCFVLAHSFQFEAAIFLFWQSLYPSGCELEPWLGIQGKDLKTTPHKSPGVDGVCLFSFVRCAPISRYEAATGVALLQHAAF